MKEKLIRAKEATQIAIKLLESRYPKDEYPPYILSRLIAEIDPYYKSKCYLVEIGLILKDGDFFVFFSVLIDRESSQSEIIVEKNISFLPPLEQLANEPSETPESPENAKQVETLIQELKAAHIL
ncbi:MAG: hypothetical protein LBL62_03405 [Planctomycetaceae bacterium]|jgi:hypothetical protein|nr:hypothetical protein [Planctomycetaceae bacterium]